MFSSHLELIFSCLHRADLIRVYDGKSSDYPVINVICNEANELEVFSTSSDIFVEFLANSEQPGQGFKANFQFQPVKRDLAGRKLLFTLNCPDT